MPIEQTKSKITLSQRDAAVYVAKAVASAGLPVPSSRFRNDVDYIQIDPIIIEYKITKRVPGVRLQFEVEGRFGVTLNIDLKQLEDDPQRYLHELFQHVRPMMRNSVKLRRNRKLASQALYEVLTEEAAND